MSLYEEPIGRVPRSGVLLLVEVLLLAALVLAIGLGWSHIEGTRGPGTALADDVVGSLFCASLSLSPWSEIKRVPLSFYALPIYAMMAWLAWVGRSAGERGQRARGGLILLSGLLTLVSLGVLGTIAVRVGMPCWPWIGLVAVHLAILALALVPPGLRLALPAGLDMILAAFLAVVVAGTSFKIGIIFGDRLDRLAMQGIEADAAVVSTEVTIREQEGDPVVLPKTTADVPIDRFDPSAGARDARVTVVVFNDLRCDLCRQLNHALAGLMDEYGDRVRFVFKHFPMDASCNSRVEQTGSGACLAARAAVCAHAQRRFFEAQAWLLRQDVMPADEDALVQELASLGLDAGTLEGCLTSPRSLEQVREDLSHAAALRIARAPQVFVNGRMFDGDADEALLEAAIRLELGEIEVDPAGRVPTREEIVADPPPPPGPVEMVRIGQGARSFSIDAVEASIDAEGRAIAIAGAAPAMVPWSAAEAACMAAGKRLCTVEEWRAACEGSSPSEDDDGKTAPRPWPYGQLYHRGWCNDDALGGAAMAGAHPACRTPEGVHDLAGNLKEWVGKADSTVFRVGGSWSDGDRASCSAIEAAGADDPADMAAGFRCCTD